MKDQLKHLVSQMLDKGLFFAEATREFEKQFILLGLEKSGGNRTKAARIMGIHRNTLSKKILSLDHSKESKKMSKSKNLLTR